MNLYLVQRSECSYDEYNAFVVAAITEAEALAFLNTTYSSGERWSKWPNEGEKTATLISSTSIFVDTQVVLGSFNAG